MYETDIYILRNLHWAKSISKDLSYVHVFLLSLNELQHSLREVTPVNETIIHFIGRKLNFPVLGDFKKNYVPQVCD